jgi:hypothetical protein
MYTITGKIIFTTQNEYTVKKTRGMAKIKLKYEIIQYNKNVGERGLEHVEFCDKIIEFERDKDPENPNKFKSEGFYFVYPRTNEINVTVLATCNNNPYYWMLKIWVANADGEPVWRLITPAAGIECPVNVAGRADYDKNLKWQ